MEYVLVTGACGGLGSALTNLLAGSGATVFAVDLEAALEAAGAPPSNVAANVIAVPADVTSPDSVAAAAAAVRSRTDRLDGLACCAGIFTGGPLAEASERALVHGFDVNVAGAHRLVKETFPLLERGGGTVVLVSSESARFAMPFNGPYTVTKYALEAYADCLRRELLLTGVRVAVVQPGAFRSGLLASAGRGARGPSSASRFARQVDLVGVMLERERARSMPADRVARVVLRALRARHPRARYRVGNHPARMLLRFLPTRAADALIRMVMR